MPTKANRELRDYDGSSITLYQGKLSYVRKRIGMFFGEDTPKARKHHCLWEATDNANDEIAHGGCTQIVVTLNEDDSVTVSDNGRGIPVDEHPERPGVSTAQVVLTELYAGGKFGGGSYEHSSGLHGVGISATNALSEWLSLDIARDKYHWHIGFAAQEINGEIEPAQVVEPMKRGAKMTRNEATGTAITFKMDDDVFGEYVPWDAALIKDRLQSSSYCNPGVEYWFLDHRDDRDEEVRYYSENGLSDLLLDLQDKRVGSASVGEDDGTAAVEPMLPEPIVLEGEVKNEGRWSVCLQWLTDHSSTARSIVNSVPTKEGGTHQDGLDQAVLNSISKYARNNGLIPSGTKLASEDVRSGIVSVVHVNIDEPELQGQTKHKLLSSGAKKMVSRGLAAALATWMDEYPAEATIIATRAVEEMQMRRKIESNLADMRSETSTKPSKNPPSSLVDEIPKKNRQYGEMYIVEGRSAGVGASRERWREYQAILALRGIFRNVLKPSKFHWSKNEVISNIVNAIGTGTGDDFDITKLRYKRIIIMSDPDAAGRHIELLTYTVILVLMPQLMTSGHVYVADTPLHVDSTRFKGLGQLTNSQIKEYGLDPKTRRLLQVKLSEEDLPRALAYIERLMGEDSRAKWEEMLRFQDLRPEAS